MENMENNVVVNEAAEAAEIAVGATTGQKVAGAVFGACALYGAYKLVRKGVELGKAAINGLRGKAAAKKAANAAEATCELDSEDETK